MSLDGKITVFHSFTQRPGHYGKHLLPTAWTVRGSNPGGGEIFRTRPHRPRGSLRLLYNGQRVCFPGVKQRMRGDDNPTPHTALQGRHDLIIGKTFININCEQNVEKIRTLVKYFPVVKRIAESSVGNATNAFIHVHTSFLFQVGMLL